MKGGDTDEKDGDCSGTGGPGSGSGPAGGGPAVEVAAGMDEVVARRKITT
jgi:hypothetical protein